VLDDRTTVAHPVRWRTVKVLQAVLAPAGIYASQVMAATLLSFYQGTGSIRPHGPSERPVEVTVDSCALAGPLSSMGLGFWSVCQVHVRTADRGVVAGVVDRSIVSQQDAGRTIELREACFDPPAGRCRYGRAAGAGWQVYAGSVIILGRTLVVILALSAFIDLFAAIQGAARWLAFQEGWRRRTGKSLRARP
jgi:hypothetical protein